MHAITKWTTEHEMMMTMMNVISKIRENFFYNFHPYSTYQTDLSTLPENIQRFAPILKDLGYYTGHKSKDFPLIG